MMRVFGANKGPVDPVTKRPPVVSFGGVKQRAVWMPLTSLEIELEAEIEPEAKEE
jgi:hypothetical protein